MTITYPCGLVEDDERWVVWAIVGDESADDAVNLANEFFNQRENLGMADNVCHVILRSDHIRRPCPLHGLECER